MPVRPAEAAAGTHAVPRADTLLRVALLAICGVSLLATAVLFTYALALARVPEHRATLENLVHAETGLDTRFTELRVRWGWYGPEAVFRAVELREPGETRPLLTAPELVLGVDLWRTLRSGDLAINRITLVEPDIDVTQASPAPAAHTARTASAPATPSPAQLLARWRGTRVDVEGGTLRTVVAGVELAAGIRQIQLRRAGTEWSAQGLLTLPEALGTTAEGSLRLHAVGAQGASLAGTLNLTSPGLQLAGWRALLKSAPGADYLPDSGSADVALQLELADGAVSRAQGTLAAAALEWPAAAPGAGLALDQLRADWRLLHVAAGWHLEVAPLALGAGSRDAAVSVDAAADGAWVRGRVQRVPAATLADLARGVLPPLRQSGLELTGSLHEGTFDWSAVRPPEARLKTSAELENLSISPRGGALTLAGLTARVSGTGASLEATLEAPSARLTLAADPALALGSVGVHARLTFTDDGRVWQVSTRALEIHQGDARLAASGVLSGENSGAHPRVDAHATVSGVPVQLARSALAAPALAALGTAALELTAGRIERAELVARGPLDEPLPWSGAHRLFAGSLALTGAGLAAGADWPDLHGVDARLSWRGARVRLSAGRATVGSFQLSAARGEWDARDASLIRLACRLTGNTQEALAWLRAHPRLEPYAPGIDAIALSGSALLGFELERAAAAAPSAPRFTTHLTALLDGAELRPVAGLPGIEALRGTLAFADGHLQHSTLTGRWLGGPITLGVGERREHGTTAVAISGKGLLDVREALAAAGVGTAETPLQGNAEWSADLRLLPDTDGGHVSWRVRADSGLAGVASGLPEPFAKAAGSTLPLHVELQGTESAGELHIALGERLRGLAAISRRGNLWRVDRGAVNFAAAAAAPVMPPTPVVDIQGSVGRLDLPGYALLWRRLGRDSAWPALHLELRAADLLAAGRSFPDVQVSADAGPGSGRLRLDSGDLAALVLWPTVIDASHPVSVHLERLDLAQLEQSGAAAALIAALGSDTQLAIGDEIHGTLGCRDGSCRASFNVDSRDAAATLERLGFRADLAAAHALASGELEWPAESVAPLERARGQLHVELENGLTRATEDGPGSSLGILAVPGFIAAMGLPQLPFARLSADFTVADGQAVTSDLRLDGDTDILMRGRIGFLAHTYDAQVWVLKGEERLPAAVRGLAPGPRVAALWMSLRELFGSTSRGHATLRLRGTWDDPMVSP